MKDILADRITMDSAFGSPCKLTRNADGSMTIIVAPTREEDIPSLETPIYKVPETTGQE